MTEPSSLEERIAALERQVRSLMATNWTDRASVVDAAGNAVQLSSLAFGQVATAPASGSVTMTGVANGGATVTSPDHTPQLTVYVSGGRLRIDFAAQLYADTGYNGVNAETDMTVAARGPYLTAAAAAAGAPGPGITDRAAYNYLGFQVSVANGGDQQGVANASTFGLLTGLPPGYYLVLPTYSFTYNSTGSTGRPSGSASTRAIAATPY